MYYSIRHILYDMGNSFLLSELLLLICKMRRYRTLRVLYIFRPNVLYITALLSSLPVPISVLTSRALLSKL